MGASERVAVGGRDTLDAYVAAPLGSGPHPGVLVLHEAFGLNDDMRRITDRFATEGYVAMAPDLFSHGNKALCLTRVLLDGMVLGPRETTAADVEGCRQALAARPDVDGSKVGVIGFCMGGGFALALAPRGGYAAASVNYGATPRRGKAALEGICPVVAAYGSTDRVMAKEPAKLEAYLTELGVEHDIKVYEGVGHSFMSNDNVPGWMARIPSPMAAGYDEIAAADNWVRILRFFGRHLGAS